MLSFYHSNFEPCDQFFRAPHGNQYSRKYDQHYGTVGLAMKTLWQWVANLWLDYSNVTDATAIFFNFELCDHYCYHDCFNPFTPKFKKYILPTRCTSEVVRIGSIIVFHLRKLWKTKFSILCDVTFLVRLQGKFEIDHSWEWKDYDYCICSLLSTYLCTD